MSASSVHVDMVGDALTVDAIVEFFDQELLAATPVELVVERAAAFGGCAVGIESAEGLPVTEAPSGRTDAGRPPPQAMRRPLQSGGLVWAAGLTPDVAEVFLTRLAVVVGVGQQRAPARPPVPHALDILIDRQASPEARTDAARKLGVAGEAITRVVVCSGPPEGIKRLAASLAEIERVLTQVTSRSGLTVLLITGRSGSLVLTGIPEGVRAAYGVIGKITDSDVSYANAVDAYRFSLPSPADAGPYPATAGVWTDGSRLSGLAALNRLSRAEIESIPDIAILQAMTEKYGEHILEILEAFATNDSLRKAAAGLYIHHNTLNYWVQKASVELGYSLSEPYRRAQLFISLCLFRLWRDKDFTE